jgi:F-type H+-transporting ATPase subunit gamma
MPNLKSLKVRIRSVKSTQKITKAMKMVSASKLRRARERVEAAAPYVKRMERMLETLAVNIQEVGAPALLVGNGKNQKHLLVVISSDRGLCGGLNTSLIKAVRRKIHELTNEGKDVILFCIGKKGKEQLNAQFKSTIVCDVEGISKQKVIPYEDIEVQAARILELFQAGNFDVCTVFYNKFISVISQKVTQQQLIPLPVPVPTEQEGTKSAKAIYEYEPNEQAILEELLPTNLAVQLFQAVLENCASEQGARMTAMDNATRNAGEMIKKLTLVYNRTRQATITKELIEIISGAEAL